MKPPHITAVLHHRWFMLCRSIPQSPTRPHYCCSICRGAIVLHCPGGLDVVSNLLFTGNTRVHPRYAPLCCQASSSWYLLVYVERTDRKEPRAQTLHAPQSLLCPHYNASPHQCTRKLYRYLLTVADVEQILSKPGTSSYFLKRFPGSDADCFVVINDGKKTVV